jgi:hypothetical protein
VDVWRYSSVGEMLMSLDQLYLAGQKWTVKVEKKALALLKLDGLFK